MSELPDGVYANDRADDADYAKRSNSSAELRAHAQMLAFMYENLQTIYLDKFITTVTPTGLASWEKTLFSSAQDSMLPYSTRQQNLLAKRRANGGISLPAISAIIHAILDPQGLAFDIFTWNGASSGTGHGAWILDFSELGYDTYLSLRDPLQGAGQGAGITPLDCNLNYAAAGLTAQQLIEIQETAYRYEVRIYGHASANTLALLDAQLTALEPARSDHLIFNDAPGPPTP